MKKFVSSIIGGLLISIAGTIYLAIENKVVGAIFFGFGLYAILSLKNLLYTGRIGYFFIYNKQEKFDLLIILLGNLIGAFIYAILLNLANLPIITQAKDLVASKVQYELYVVLIRAVFCGIMISIAVEMYKKVQSGFGKEIGVFMPVVIFILSGFEHCVANMFYFFYSLTFTLEMWLSLIITIIGNSLGSILIITLFRIAKKEEKKEETN